MSDLASAFAQAGVNHQQLAQFLSQHGQGGALQTVTKTVHRDGKTFQQTFHVQGKKPEASKEDGKSAATPDKKPNKARDANASIKEALKKDGADAAVKKAGGDPAQVNKLVQDWADHGGSEGAIKLRSAVAKAAGVNIDEGAKGRMAFNHAHFKSEYEGESIPHADARAAVDKHSQVTDADVKNAKAMAKVSQAAYGDATHVDLYRGITGAQAQQIKDALARGETKIKIAVDGVSSFTDNHGSARSFAKGKGGQGATSSGGVVIKAKVPVKSVVMSHKAFKQLKGEDEVAIASKGVIEINAADIELH
jgi:hypothetical protein